MSFGITKAIGNMKVEMLKEAYVTTSEKKVCILLQWWWLTANGGTEVKP
jgi:hypothetical protein